MMTKLFLLGFVRHALGKQPLSMFKTLPSYGFGSSSFTKESKRFLTVGHTREWKVRRGLIRCVDRSVAFSRLSQLGLQGLSEALFHQTPENMSSFGKQPLSNRAVSPSHRFSQEQRLIFKPSTVPGESRRVLRFCVWYQI